MNTSQILNTNQNVSLYKIGSEYQQLFSQLYDHETGEVNEEVDAQLSALADTAEKKCIAVASWAKKMEAEKKEIEFMKEQILRREAAYEKEINKVYDYLESNMNRCNIKEIKCAAFTIRRKLNPYSTEIINKELLPEKFIKKTEKVVVTESADKNAIKEEVLRTGIQVPGAIVQQKTKLEILVDKI